MTTVNLAAVAAALQTEFEPDIISQINRSSPLLQLLPVKRFRGQNVTFDVRFGSAGAGSGAAIAEGADVSTFNTDTKVPAVLQFVTMHEAFEVTGVALAAAMNSGQPQALVDLFGEEVTAACQRLAHAIGSEMYNGTGAANRMTGLIGGGALATTGTYAGLARGTYAQWAGNVLANGGVPRALALALMRQSMREAYIDSGFRPDVIVCDPIQFDKYGALIDPQRRFVDSVRTASGEIKLDGGYRALEFDGRMLVEDVNCPAGKMIFLSSQKVCVAELPQLGLDAARSAGERPLSVGADEKNDGRLMLSARVQPLAVLGDKYRFAIYVYVQMVVKQPNACCVLEDLVAT